MESKRSRRIDLALSGGGTRAALYSGGALVAVTEAVSAGGVEVGAIRSVSGSSLLLARLMLADDDLADNASVPERQTAIRTELEAIVRFGFAPSPWTAFGLSVVPSLLFFVLMRLAIRAWPDPPSRSVLPIMFGAFVLWAVVFLGIRRGSPFNLRRGRLSWLRNSGSQQYKWFADEHRATTGLVPSVDLGFVSTKLADGRTRVLDPWATYERGTRPDRSRASLGDCAAASAAVPFYGSAVEIDEQLLVDGGVVDNLGLSGFWSEEATHDVECPDASSPDALSPDALCSCGDLIVVDASVPSPPEHVVAAHVPVSLWHDVVRSSLPLFFAGLLVVLGLLYGFVVLPDGLAVIVMIAVTFLFVVILVRSFTTAFGPLILTLFFALRNEAGVVRAVMLSNRRNGELRLRLTGRRFSYVSLTAAPPFSDEARRKSHDLKTRLSAVRGDTAVVLVEAAYMQTIRLLGTSPDIDTLRWLERLRDEFRPTVWDLRGRRVRSATWHGIRWFFFGGNWRRLFRRLRERVSGDTPG